MHLQDGIGGAEERPRVRDQGRPGLLVGVIGEKGLDSGTGLDADLEAGGGQLRDAVGDEGNAPLAGGGLLRTPTFMLRARLYGVQRGGLWRRGRAAGTCLANSARSK